MTKHWNLLKSLAAVLMIVGVAACASVIASPPQDLVSKNDHAGLEAFYVKEAAHLRQRAKDMTTMAEVYRKNPEVRLAGEKDMVNHCRTLEGLYTKTADQAEVMARVHRDMSGRS